MGGLGLGGVGPAPDPLAKPADEQQKESDAPAGTSMETEEIQQSVEERDEADDETNADAIDNAIEIAKAKRQETTTGKFRGPEPPVGTLGSK